MDFKFNKNGHKNCNSCVCKTPLFALLNIEELEEVDKNRFDLTFKSGEIIRKQGAFLSHVIIIVSGLASIYIEGINDKNLILKMVKPGSIMGGPGMFVDQRHHYTVKSHGDTETCFVDIKTFKKLLHSNSLFAEEFFKDFSRNTLTIYSRLISLAQQYVPGKLAEALIYLSEEIFESRQFNPMLSSSEIGALAGISTDSVLKTFRELKKNKIIAQNGNILEILDFDGLRHIGRIG